MRVTNVHARSFPRAPDEVGTLIDSLATPGDRLWPRDHWPAMRLDRPLAVGAVGGHGPIRYRVEEFEPGRRVRFRFTAPRGFHGTHELAVEALEGGARLLHRLEMRTTGPALLTWPLVFRPLHDALLEDAFDRAADHLGVPPRRTPWSPWVRGLRRVLSRRRRTSTT